MAVNRWCMQCALDPEFRRERPAVGVDEEGEPACFEHKVKSGETKPAEPVQSQEVPAPEVTSSEGKALSMTERICSADGCSKVLKANNQSGRCTKHYYVPKGKRARKPKPEKSTALVRVEAVDVHVVTPDLAGLDLLGLRDRLRADLAAVERVIQLGLGG